MRSVARRRGAHGVPTLDINLYDDPTVRDSRATFARIRDAGPVVWLPRHRMYAIGRFADVRAALRDDAVFRSGKGVAANPIINLGGRGTTLFSDEDTHARRRRVLMRSLGAKALGEIGPRVEAEADRLISGLAGAGWFEASRSFASHLPLSIVAELVGVRADGRRLLNWAAAAFDGLGPFNSRARRAGLRSAGLLVYSRRLSPGRVRPGSWASAVFEARDKGEISTAEAQALCIDLVAPALDTTILASTFLLWTLSQHPDAWSAIRTDSSLIPRAVVENVRVASPIRGFTRTLAQDHVIGNATLPSGSRVVLLFGAANLDETEFPDPERFDLSRPNTVQLGWGNGPHTCVGIHLAKLEMHALLEAMVARVERIEARDPQPLLNNTLQGLSRLTARLLPA